MNNELIGHLTGNGSISGGTLTRKGDTGRGISSIIEKYAVSTSNTTSPTTWYNNPSDAVMTSTNKYLWNYEIVTYTDNTSEETAKRIIGIYGDKGSTGDTGNGITSTTITYGVSSSPSTMPSSWSSSIPTTISDGDYLWTKITINYTDTSMQDTVIYTYAKQGEKGDTGSAGTSVTVSSIKYQEGTSATTAPTGTWSDSVVAVADGNYLWTKITFSDGNIAYGVAKQGEQGATYDDTEVRGLIQGNTDDIEDIQEEQIVQNERIDALESLVPQGTATGESITINDSARYKFKNIVVGGNTKQDTSKITYTCAGTETGTYYFTYNSINYQFTMPTVTEGDILVFDTLALTLSLDGATITTTTGTSGTLITFSIAPNPDFPQEIINIGSNINLFDKDNANILNGFFNGNRLDEYNITRTLYLKIKPNTYYSVSKKQSERFDVATTQNIPTFGITVSNKISSPTAKEITILSGVNDNYLMVYYYKSDVDTLTEEQVRSSIKIEEGKNITGYTPYNRGGIDFLVQNKNLFNKNAEKTYYYYDGSGNKVTSSQSYINQEISFSNKYKISFSATHNAYIRFVELGDNDVFIKRTLINTSLTTINIDENTRKVIICVDADVSQNKYFENLMVEKGETATTYVEHQEQNITIPLPQGMELCKIGNYKDYIYRSGNKWYKHKEYKSEIVNSVTANDITSQDSNTMWGLSYSATNYNSDLLGKSAAIYINILSDKFKVVPLSLEAQSGICLSAYGHSDWVELRFRAPKTYTQQETADFINGAKVYYPCAPVEEEITDTDFIEQAEAMLNMYSYKGITHIDSDNEPSPVFEVVYFKDFETILNNIEARLSLLE